MPLSGRINLTNITQAAPAASTYTPGEIWVTDFPDSQRNYYGADYKHIVWKADGTGWDTSGFSC